MKKEVINMAKAVALPYSSAIRAGDYIFISGQVGHLDEKGNPINGVEAQTRQCISRLTAVLEKAGASLSDVVKSTVFLGSQADFPAMNNVYKEYFVNEPPARSTVVVAFPMAGMLVEIECIAYRPGK